MITQTTESLDLFFEAAFSIDLALFTFHQGKVKVLLQKKDEQSAAGEMGLLGKLIHPSDDTEVSLLQLCKENTGTDSFYFKQLRAFTELGRHPEGRVITIAYYGLISYDQVQFREDFKSDWYDIDQLPALPYDHNRIVQVAKHRLRKGLLRHPTVFEMLPVQFILRDVIDIYEQAFGQELDAPNLRRQIRESGLVEPVGYLPSMDGRMGRRPQLFTFMKDRYLAQRKQVKIGFNPVAKGPIV